MSLFRSKYKCLFFTYIAGHFCIPILLRRYLLQSVETIYRVPNHHLLVLCNYYSNITLGIEEYFMPTVMVL